MKFLRSQQPPCRWGPSVCAVAAREKKWDVLKWMRTEADPPCPWYADTESKAKAYFGEAEVASWSR